VYRRAGGECAHSKSNTSRIAGDHRDVVVINAEFVSGDLRQYRFVRLTVRRSTGVHADLAGGGDAQRHTLVRTETGRFDSIGNAHADEPALPARAPLPFCEFAITGRLERGGLTNGIIAAVISHRPPVTEYDTHLVGHLLRLNEIAAADLGGIEFQFARDA